MFKCDGVMHQKAALRMQGRVMLGQVLVLMALSILLLSLGACVQRPLAGAKSVVAGQRVSAYEIQSGDLISVFVWRNPEISVEVQVRPDGQVSTPLVEDMLASGKSPTQLARDIEKSLSKFIRDPMVTVIIKGFSGDVTRRVRVMGAAAKPMVLPYRKGMSLLDVMISVGGLTDYAAGNRAKVVRQTKQGQTEFPVRLDDLMSDGDISANVELFPGDILIIPESIF